jgi:hypothetical protein
MRIVGFDEEQQLKLATSQEKKEAAALATCEIKQGRQSRF